MHKPFLTKPRTLTIIANHWRLGVLFAGQIGVKASEVDVVTNQQQLETRRDLKNKVILSIESGPVEDYALEQGARVYRFSDEPWQSYLGKKLSDAKVIAT